MKNIFVIVTLLVSFNAFSNSATEILAWTFAETIYISAITGASAEVSSNITSSKQLKAEALKLQNEIQNYFQSGEISPFLNNKITLANTVAESLSQDEVIDVLLESTTLILNK